MVTIPWNEFSSLLCQYLVIIKKIDPIIIPAAPINTVVKSGIFNNYNNNHHTDSLNKLCVYILFLFYCSQIQCRDDKGGLPSTFAIFILYLF